MSCIDPMGSLNEVIIPLILCAFSLLLCSLLILPFMHLYDNPRLIIDSSRTEPGEVIWKSPSNLALVKYWGKHGHQLPRNPSLSITLNEAFTQTSLSYVPNKGPDKGIELDFVLDGVPNEKFRQRLLKFFEAITPIFPFIPQLKWTIATGNSFPHSAGIASSASAMSALSLCLCSIEQHLFGFSTENDEMLLKASYVARLGSGSACRSVYPVAAWWGRHEGLSGSSDLFAVPVGAELHDEVKTLLNAILIISDREKSVSSSAGHALMEGHHYASRRFDQAANRCIQLLDAAKTADWEQIIRITESEALTLHALMMASNPPYILLESGSIEVIRKVRDFRSATGKPVFFSMDAGPNVHLLYRRSDKEEVEEFINAELLQLCKNNRVLYDSVGNGPVQINREH